MTPSEADFLAKRIINVWRGGPPLNEWQDALATLNTEQANETFMRVRDELKHAPSIAEFKSAYRALQRGHLDQSWRQTPEPNPISFSEYLAKVRAEAPDRADELERLTHRQADR